MNSFFDVRKGNLSGKISADVNKDERWSNSLEQEKQVTNATKPLRICERLFDTDVHGLPIYYKNF